MGNSYKSPLDYATGGRGTSGAEYRPRKLWLRAVEYFEFMRDKVWNHVELLKGGAAAGTPCNVPVQTPLQLRGFLVFAGLTRGQWQRYRTDPDFADICDRIEMMIETQNIEGAMVGAYNGSFTARLLGLADKTEAAVEVHQPRDLTPEEAAAVVGQLNNEY